MECTSLLETVVEYCHEDYQNYECDNCNHPNDCPGECLGYCKNCLEQVHYPTRYPYGKKDYDCERMLDFYVCDYIYKYASEMIYLIRKSNALRKMNEYRVVSIGCGSCPDLMAFEEYCLEEENEKVVKYVGIDVNEMWSNIHQVIGDYKTSTIGKVSFKYVDAVTDDYDIKRANVIVLQYVISHFYNTNQINQISGFFDKLIEKIIDHRQNGTPFVVLINDVNSNNRGRDYFEMIVKKLENHGFHGMMYRYYFDYNIQNCCQRFGARHESNDILFDIPDYISEYQPWEKCSSAQMLIEVN